jgi:hypothetical protein
VQPYGSGGLLGFADAAGNSAPALPITAAALDTAPVTTWSKHKSGKPINCQQPQAIAPSDAGK